MSRRAPILLRSAAVLLPALLLAGAGMPRALHAQPSPAAPKPPLTVDDLYRLEGPRGLVLSPDGQRAAYLRQWIDPETRGERQSLWSVAGAPDQARPLEKEQPDARSAVFSPDGKWIAFVSTRPRPKGWRSTPPVPPESDPAVDLWLIPAAGGKAIPLAGPDKPYGRVFNDGFYGRVAFSPDGKRLAFVADDGVDPRTREEIEADVMVVRPDQGEGYTGYGTARVWIADLDPTPGRAAADRIRQLTHDNAWYGDPQWSADGRSLVVHANRTDDRESVRFSINKNYDLWAIDVLTGGLRQLTAGPGPEISPRFSPDGKRLACLTLPRKGAHREVASLALVDWPGATPRSRVLFDHHSPGAGPAPHLAPSFPLPDECWDGPDHLVYTSAQRTATVTARVNVETGKGETLDLSGGAASPLADRMRQRSALTPRGNLILQERVLGETRVVEWENEGLQLDGLLTLPPAGHGKGPYPLLVYPHGGPHSRASQGFDLTVQVFAAHGYAVFQPNFRGSEGYGQKFIEADRFDLGGGDMRDILTGIQALEKQGIADPQRQFVYGVSYGGFMTAWLVGQTDRFRAAVAQNAVTDLNVMWGLSDIQSWTEWEFGGYPWEVPVHMRQHSPFTHLDKVRTPTLILHSRDDRRCPLPMGRMFHQGLLARKVPTEMVIYPNEGHGIRQPRHRADVLRRVLAWFSRHGGA